MDSRAVKTTLVEALSPVKGSVAVTVNVPAVFERAVMTAAEPVVGVTLSDGSLVLQRSEPAVPGAAQRAYCWLGMINCVKPSVLMSRNVGVRGGRSAGVRKFVSKL